MAVTITYDGRQNTNKKLGAAMSRGLKAIAAQINFSGLSNAISSGIVCSFVGFGSIDSVMIEPQSGYQIYYDSDDGVIRIPQLATGVSLGSWTAVKCWVWGS